jgi:hypothetical protein
MNGLVKGSVAYIWEGIGSRQRMLFLDSSLTKVLGTAVLLPIVNRAAFPYNRVTMSPSFFAKLMIGSARWAGLGAILAVLSLTVAAAPITPVTVGFNFTLDNLPGSVAATYNSSAHPLTDSTGTYVDASDGLESFDVKWDGNTYTMTESLDYDTLPELLLPGNTLNLNGSYGFVGDWLISGSLPGGDILGVSANVPAYLLSDVSVFNVSDIVPLDSSAPELNIGADFGSIIYGSVVVPEPVILPLTALGLAGLWFARRRKASL